MCRKFMKRKHGSLPLALAHVGLMDVGTSQFLPDMYLAGRSLDRLSPGNTNFGMLLKNHAPDFFQISLASAHNLHSCIVSF